MNYSIKLNEIINWFYNGYKDEVVKTHTVEADTKEELFKKIYAFERSSRYDNARHYTILDETISKEYRDWKANGGVTIDLYYGGGIVD